jgi:hypothetical protein
MLATVYSLLSKLPPPSSVNEFRENILLMDFFFHSAWLLLLFSTMKTFTIVILCPKGLPLDFSMSNKEPHFNHREIRSFQVIQALVRRGRKVLN